jgi:hypothetical protein
MTREEALIRALTEFGYLCGDCGTAEGVVDPACFDQRGEPICTWCAARGAYDPD